MIANLVCAFVTLFISLPLFTNERATSTRICNNRSSADGIHALWSPCGNAGRSGVVKGPDCSYIGNRNRLAFVTRKSEARHCNYQPHYKANSLALGAGNKNKAPDLSSTLLSERIIFLGYPIHSTVAHLVISQLLYLDNVSQKPIKIYINCADEEVEEDPALRPEIDALNIVDVMRYVKSDIITVNFGKAYGSAALILSAGTPGKRFVLPRSFTAVRQPSASLEMMQAEDLRIYSKEILKAREEFVKELAKCCNKPQSTILDTIKRGAYFDAEETIAYGLADKVLNDN